jgi:hypothetical protein
MTTFAAGSTVTLTIPFLDLNGDPVVPTAISAVVHDQDGTEVVPAYAPSFTPGDTEVDIVVPKTANQVSGPMGARTVYLDLTLANGDLMTLMETYLLRGAVRLTVPSNSFQTYVQALVEAALMPELTGWAAATEINRLNALEEAYRRLTRIGFLIRRPEDVDDMTYYVIEDENRIEPRAWTIMTSERYARFPAHFRKALCRAQIQEASEILSGDVVSDKRRQGLLSESIGESSMMFRSGKPLEMGVSTRTRQHLTGYIDMRMSVTRS